MGWTIEDRDVLVTGGISGIGLATAAELARRGARVTITARDGRRGCAAGDTIAMTTGATVDVRRLDLASFASIRSFVDDWRPVDLAVVVCNAGVFLGRRRSTDEGFEATFGINHLGHFLLVSLLRDRLVAAPTRVVVVASDAHRRVEHLDVDALPDPRRYRALEAYARSKLCNVLFARELDRRLGDDGVAAWSFHPGVVATRIAQDGDSVLPGVVWKLLSPWMRSPEEGARTAVRLATDHEVGQGGRYLVDETPVPPSPLARDEGFALRLWRLSERLVDGT